MNDMPEILAIRKNGATWANYLCRSGRGGSEDTNYVKEEKLIEAEAKINKLVKIIEEAADELDEGYNITLYGDHFRDKLAELCPDNDETK